MLTILSALAAFTLLIAFHEYGHFAVARACGVTVLKFSIGFGKPILRFHDSKGTAYVVCMIPLGGYVQMLESHATTAANHRQCFDMQSLTKRIAIVVAGPLANLVLALVLYSMAALMGVTTMAAYVDAPSKLAATAGMQRGDMITAIDGQPIHNWQDAHFALLQRIGDSGAIVVDVTQQQAVIEQIQQSWNAGVELPKLVFNTAAAAQYQLPIADWLSTAAEPDTLAALGIAPLRLDVPARIQRVVENSPAAAAGILTNDKITAVNQLAIVNWSDFVARVIASNGATLAVGILRDGQPFTLQVTPIMNQTNKRYSVGVQVVMPALPAELYTTAQPNVLQAVWQGGASTLQMVKLTLVGLYKLITGKMSIQTLSGPLRIAKYAGQSAEYGLQQFIIFCALLSVSLGVLNMLPIPMLDGGHLFFYCIEAVRGVPLSAYAQQYAMRFGMVFLALFMGIAVFNDFVAL